MADRPTEIQLPNGMIEVYSYTTTSLEPYDLYLGIKRKDVVIQQKVIELSTKVRAPRGIGKSLDTLGWLPFASKVYNISPDIRDYVVVPVLTIPSDIPNRNGVGFPLKEMVRYNPVYGMQNYKTFKGKPTFVEHDNRVAGDAQGVILDSYMRKMTGYGSDRIWKLLELLAFDRSKNPELARVILNNEGNGYSMGARHSGYTCSICEEPWGMCQHSAPYVANNHFGPPKLPFKLVGGKLLYKQATNPVGFETSYVKSPAYTTAISDHILDLSQGIPAVNTDNEQYVEKF